METISIRKILFFIILIFVSVNAASSQDGNLSEKEDIGLDEKIVKNYEKLNEKTFNHLQKKDIEKQNYLVKYKNQKTFPSQKDFKKIKIAKTHMTTDEILSVLDEPNIEYIEIDQSISILSDTIPEGIQKTQAPTVWNITKGNGINVAIIDTGIAQHDDLDITSGVSFVSDTYSDTYGHGTAVAGIVSGLLNNAGIVGVAPDSEIYSVKIMNESTGSLSDAIEAIDWCLENNIDIITMSFGFEDYSQIFKEAVEDAYDEGLLLIAAAGNDGTLLYPAGYTKVIAVGSVDDDNDKSYFSPQGVELVAHGEDVNTTGLLNGYSLNTGTSFSAPHVTGAAALIWSNNSSLTNEQVRGKMQNDALNLGNFSEFGYGLVQINIETADYNHTEENYYYEIFNITEDEFVFWLNGTGTIDDIYFEEGYYLVNKSFNGKVTTDDIYVNENSEIIILGYNDGSCDPTICSNPTANNGLGEGDCTPDSDSNSAITGVDCLHQDIICADLYECTPYDISGTIYYHTGLYYNEAIDGCYWAWDDDCDNCYETRANSLNVCSEHCDDWDGDYVSPYLYVNPVEYWDSSSYTDYCEYYKSKTLYEYKCNSNYQVARETVDCDDYTIYHEIYQCQDDNLYKFKENGICTYGQCVTEDIYEIYQNCSDGCDNSACNYCGDNNCYGAETSLTCLNDCPSSEIVCGNAICETGESCSSCPTDCGVCICDASIQVDAEDNDDIPLDSISVYFDDVLQGTTSSLGIYDGEVTNVTCGSQIEVKVKCEDNTVCGVNYNTIRVDGAENTVSFDCSICSTENDIYITQKDIVINMTSKKVKVPVHSIGITGNVYIALYRQKNDGTLEQEDILSQYISLSADEITNVTFTLSDLNSTDYIHIYLDSSDLISNEDESNNYIFRPALRQIKAKVIVNGNPAFYKANDIIEEYIGSFVEIKNENEDVTIYVGEYNDLICGLESQNEQYYAVCEHGELQTHTKPYTGIIIKEDSKIFAYGTGIDGTIAAVKRMINARNVFFDKKVDEYKSFIDDYDTLGISVYDILHNSENMNYYGNNDEFVKIVSDVLYDNNFEVSIKPVKTLNGTSYNKETQLRIKHVNSDFSEKYKEALGINDTPVVFSGGLFSYLETWEDSGLAREMSEEGWDVWEIEMTGGPNTECVGCPNYTYEDLVDYYWPASIAGIAEYSGKNNIHYVGHSNGGRVALSSLNKYSTTGKDNAGYYFDYNTGEFLYSDLPMGVVDKLILVAAPGVLNDHSSFVDVARKEVIDGSNLKVGDLALAKISSSHLSMNDFTKYAILTGIANMEEEFLDQFLVTLAGWGLSFGGEPISKNLMIYYKDLAIETNSSLNLAGVYVKKAYLYYTKFKKLGITLEHDVLVPFNDMEIINKSINESVNVSLYDIIGPMHSSIKKDKSVKIQIKSDLND